jgi:hypothetical protein
MVDRRIVKLKFTQQEAENYFPPKGINVIWLEWFAEKGEVIAEFVCSELDPDPIFRKNMNDIRHELGTTFRNRVVQDNLSTHPNSPRRALVIESILNHPFITGETKGLIKQDLLPAGRPIITKEIQDAAQHAIDIHEIEYEPQQVEEQFRLASTGQRLNIKPDDVRQERRLEQVLSPEHGGITRYREVYGPEKRVYRSGVLDSG